MAGLGIRLFTDENISPRVALALQPLGYDVESCQAAKRSRQKVPDYSQLKYAIQEQRTLLTFNRADFAQLHAMWQARRGWRHFGIIVAVQDGLLVPELIRRVQKHLDTVAVATQDNQLLELAS